MLNIHFSQEELNELVERAVEAAKSYLKIERWAEAESILKQALKIDPDCEPVLQMLGEMLTNRQRGGDAIVYYEKILATKPDDYVALNNAALCYQSLGRHDLSIPLLNRCLELYPEPSVYSNLALQYKEKGDLETAFKHYEKGIEQHPNDVHLHYHYGIALGESFRFEEAIFHYKKAIEINPDFASANWNLSLVNLLTGNYKEGWDGYEWRFKYTPVFEKFKQRFKGKEWNGEEAVGEQTILVYNEQGAGDVVQFARFLPKVKAKGFRVILETMPELVELMGQCQGIDQVVPQRQKKMPDHDYQVSLGSLPRIFGIDSKEQFWTGAYVKPTGEIEEKVFDAYKGKFKIGICWAGNPVHQNDKTRSAFLKDFKVLNDLPNVKLFSLQKDSRPRYWAGRGVVDLTEGCDQMSVVDMGDMLINFNYTAAIIKSMDLVVTVDTAIAHIAGAMGVPCYLLVSKMPDWRWGLNDNKTAWYPSIKIERQLTPEDYETRLKKIAYEVAKLQRQIKKDENADKSCRV
jgi:tetratricopeptide (TPR) repeat protein